MAVADVTAVRRALGSVLDPDLKQSIVALEMVRGIDVDGGLVRISVALTVPSCPLHQRIRDDIVKAVAGVPGIEHVQVTLGVMTDEERRRTFRAAQRLRAAVSEPESGPSRPGLSVAGSPDVRIIGIASGKGGVGKSTVTANLAVALAQMGFHVGLIDMDLYGFSQGRMLGAHARAEATPDRKIVPWRRHGIQLVSMGMFASEEQAVMWRGPLLGKMMQQFFQDVVWDALDYLLLDLPPGTGDTALDVAQKVSQAELLLVTTPQPVATAVAVRAANVARKLQQRILGVVENMSWAVCPHGEAWDVFGSGGGLALANALSVPLLGQVPLEPSVRVGADAGVPVVVRDPASPAATALWSIAAQLTQLAGRPTASEPSAAGAPPL
jgi:ATP-binding protein involved in chromosome partitioning